jgi:hypothetical protein
LFERIKIPLKKGKIEDYTLEELSKLYIYITKKSSSGLSDRNKRIHDKQTFEVLRLFYLYLDNSYEVSHHKCA